MKISKVFEKILDKTNKAHDFLGAHPRFVAFTGLLTFLLGFATNNLSLQGFGLGTSATASLFRNQDRR